MINKLPLINLLIKIIKGKVWKIFTLQVCTTIFLIQRMSEHDYTTIAH